MRSAGIQSGIHGGTLHRFPDPLPGDVQHGTASVLGVEGRQIGQALQQIRGIGTSRPLGDLLPGASARTLSTGGSWLSRRSVRRRDSASETLSPVLSMIRKAMRVG